MDSEVVDSAVAAADEGVAASETDEAVEAAAVKAAWAAEAAEAAGATSTPKRRAKVLKVVVAEPRPPESAVVETVVVTAAVGAAERTVPLVGAEAEAVAVAVAGAEEAAAVDAAVAEVAAEAAAEVDAARHFRTVRRRTGARDHWRDLGLLAFGTSTAFRSADLGSNRRTLWCTWCTWCTGHH